MRLPVVGLLLIFILTAAQTVAQGVYQIQNRWKTNEFVHVEQPQPVSGPIAPGWLSAQWKLVPVEGTGFYQIQNVWRGQSLHIERGVLECGPIEPGWWSAQWGLETVEGTTFVRLRNRWKPDVALHNQNGYLEAGPIDLGWWSAQWQLYHVQAPVEQNPVVETSESAMSFRTTESSGSRPAARGFAPQNNGTLGTAYVRYTDQIVIEGAVQPGTRIYFFPQQINTDERLHPNFDPRNAPICGQTYTVLQVSPSIKLDREMPYMRNDENHHFKFVVELY